MDSRRSILSSVSLGKEVKWDKGNRRDVGGFGCRFPAGAVISGKRVPILCLGLCPVDGAVWSRGELSRDSASGPGVGGQEAEPSVVS